MDSRIHVGGQVNRYINFAMQQNSVPIIRNLVLTNKADEDLTNIKLKITFEPEFARTFEVEIPRIEKGRAVEVSPVRIAVSADYLMSLNERMSANAHYETTENGEVVFTKDVPITLLSYDEWTGLRLMPEILGAFITPNHPAVTQVIAKASEFLNKWIKDPSFTGYQRQNPNDVKIQCAAIYAALQTMNVAYSNPPASYEDLGQKIRLPSTVLEQKMGTCLDLSLLFASCLEAVGLNAIVLFLKGHAFCGCHYEEETFPDCTEDDVAAITKRIATGIEELCLVECTDFVAGKNVEFDKAEKHGKDHFIELSDFEMAVDVARMRGTGIRPIPMRIIENGQFKAADYGERRDVTAAPSALDLTSRGIVAEGGVVTKQKIWERKLLDLSLRNTLLSFRPTKTSIQLMTANLAQLEDELARGCDFKIMPVPTEIKFNLRDSKIFEIENERDLIQTIAVSEFKNNRIRTFITDAELEKSMKFLHRQAKSSLEENGTNTMYLALGFLRWFETDVSQKPRYAPLVLVPIDIVRKVQDKAYVIRIRDEETQMNITLLEMLRQDFGIDITGLDPIPTDESGVDIPLVFNTVRRSVMAKKRWDVEEYAFIGLFSFSRFIMWNDIRNRSDELRANKVVASLISGKTEWTDDGEPILPEELDEKLKPADMAVPTSADSSQLAAIAAAAQGKSFVLHGPPGTGKSQTITNMIANALFQGKSVLFVAEKMAALEVVQRRLAGIGLAPFCLELHSNKAQKRAVLEQLDKTLNVVRRKSPEKYDEEADKLHKLRTELNEAVSELHKKRKYGMSLYEVISRYEQFAQYKGRMVIDRETLNVVEQNVVENWHEAVRSVITAGRECGGYINSPLKRCSGTFYSIEHRDKLDAAVTAYLDCLKLAETAYRCLTGTCHITPSCTYGEIMGMSSLSSAIIGCRTLLPEVVSHSMLEIIDADVNKVLQTGIEVQKEEQELLKLYETSVLEFNAQEALLKWKKADSSWFLSKSIEVGKLVKEMKLFAKDPSTVEKENLADIYRRLSDFADKKRYIDRTTSEVSSLFGALWKGAESDFAMLTAAYTDSCGIRDGARKLSAEAEDKTAVTRLIDGICANINSRSVLLPQLQAFVEAFGECTTRETELINTYSVTLEDLRADGDWFSGSIAAIREIKDNVGNLKDWVTLCNKLDELRRLNLGALANGYMDGSMLPEELMPVLDCNLCYALAVSTITSTPALANFSGAQFEDTVAQYRNLTEEFRKLTVNELSARLSAKIPKAAANAAGSSDMGILQKAIKSGGRAMSIRKLFDSIPALLRRISPCMLMSPISVAQYIDPSYPKFDLVIFDEASQLPTCEAVGAIARGENVVVVGDPRQLPPTTFFMGNRVDEENYEIEDLESVLDDCLAVSMPQEHLLWHYRSRHESLIAFSNARFYENKLYTFPSPNDLVSEVKYINVDGYYDKGGSRCNKAEAKAVVDEIVRRLSDEKLRGDSIGVVTFSVVQQVLIDDMLAEAFVANPELEKLNDNSSEPIIIKNLENVQGDERDVILFSIGYGPDKDGKVSMNFGPLNNDGGWRRLNVAVSRARKQMLVYSTLRPEQIELARTRSDGVAGLKAFLEFASRGKNVVTLHEEECEERSTALIELIAGEIRKLGYDVRCEIGSSRYKIDIGVVNPDNPDGYVLGIMLDGDTYKNASTSRDRNIVQPSVLGGLGWRLCRVWSLDWFDNPLKVIQRIKSEILTALDAYRNNEPVPAQVQVNAAAPEAEEVKEVPEEQEPAQTAYELYKRTTIVEQGTPEEFTSPENAIKLSAWISQIVNTEAPVSKRIVAKTAMALWGITRTGARIEAAIDGAINNLGMKTTEEKDKGSFYWRPDQDPETYDKFRVPESDEDKRAMDEICTQEIAAAIRAVMREQFSMDNTDLVHETGKLFGYTRQSVVVERAVTLGIIEAENRGYITVSEDGCKITCNE